MIWLVYSMITIVSKSLFSLLISSFSSSSLTHILTAWILKIFQLHPSDNQNKLKLIIPSILSDIQAHILLFIFYSSQIELFTLFWIYMCSVAQLCPTLCNRMDYSLPGSSVHRIHPDMNTGVGFHFLLQGIFPPRDWTCVFLVSWIGKRILYQWAPLDIPLAISHWVFAPTLTSFWTFSSFIQLQKFNYMLILTSSCL